MTVAIPRTGGRIEAELIPIQDPSLPLAVKLGRSGHVVYALPANAEDGISNRGVHARRTGHHGVTRNRVHR